MTDKFDNYISKLKKFMASPEGKASIRAYAKELADKAAILRSQIDRFHTKYGHDLPTFKSIFKKIDKKYNTKKYVNRWYNRSIEPPNSLFWFLYEYAAVYGRESTEEEFKKYGNMFTSSMFYYGGYYFSIMNGQGSVIQIYEEKSQHEKPTRRKSKR